MEHKTLALLHSLSCSNSSGWLLAILKLPHQALDSSHPDRPLPSVQICGQGPWPQSPDRRNSLPPSGHLPIGQSMRYWRCSSHLRSLVSDSWLRFARMDQSCCAQRIHRSKCLSELQTSLAHTFQRHLTQLACHRIRTVRKHLTISSVACAHSSKAQLSRSRRGR